MPPLISLKEAAARFSPHISHSHLRRLAREGKIQAVRMGRDWFTTEQAVADFIARVKTRRGRRPKQGGEK